MLGDFPFSRSGEDAMFARKVLLSLAVSGLLATTGCFDGESPLSSRTTGGVEETSGPFDERLLEIARNYEGYDCLPQPGPKQEVRPAGFICDPNFSHFLKGAE